MRFDAVSFEIALAPGAVPARSTPADWRRRILEALDRIERAAQQLRAGGVETPDDVERLDLEAPWAELQSCLSLHAPGVVWSLGKGWYDALLECIRRDRERLRSAAGLAPPGPLDTSSTFSREAAMFDLAPPDLLAVEAGTIIREVVGPGGVAEAMARELRELERMARRLAPAPLEVLRVALHPDPPAGGVGMGRAIVRLCPDRSADPRLALLVVTASGLRAEILVRRPAPKGARLFAAAPDTAARALLTEGIAPATGWLDRVAVHLRAVADRLPSGEIPRSLAELLRDPPRAGQLAALAGWTIPIRHLDGEAHSEIATRLLRLSEIEPWPAVREYAVAVVGALPPSLRPSSLFAALVGRCPEEPSRDDLIFLLDAARWGGASDEAGVSVVRAGLNLVARRRLDDALASNLLAVLRPATPLVPATEGALRPLGFDEMTLAILAELFLEPTSAGDDPDVSIDLRPLIRALDRSGRDTGPLLRAIAKALAVRLPGVPRLGSVAPLRPGAAFDGLRAFLDLPARVRDPDGLDFESLARPWHHSPGMIPFTFWPLLRTWLAGEAVPPDLLRAYLIEAALMHHAIDGGASDWDERGPALAPWLADNGADPSAYRTLARRLLERIPDGADEARWSAALFRIASLRTEGIGGMDAPSLARCAPSPAGGRRARAEWEATLAEAVARPGSARCLLARWHLTALLDGRATDPATACALLERLGPDAFDPAVWENEPDLIDGLSGGVRDPRDGLAIVAALETRLRAGSGIAPEDLREFSARSDRSPATPAGPGELSSVTVVPAPDPSPIALPRPAQSGPERKSGGGVWAKAALTLAVGSFLLSAFTHYQVWDLRSNLLPRESPGTEETAGENASIASTTLAPLEISLGPPSTPDRLEQRTLTLKRGNRNAVMVLVRFGGPGKTLQFSRLEKGAKEVDVPTFYLGQTEVTREQFRVVTGDVPRLPNGFPDDNTLPVTNVSFEETVRFCDALNAPATVSHTKGALGEDGGVNRSTQGFEFRFQLPEQYQWEYAAKSLDWDGLIRGARLAPLKGDGGARVPGPAVAEQRPPSALYDLIGNAQEWMNGWYADENEWSIGRARDQRLAPESGVARSVRGGSVEDKPDKQLLTSSEPITASRTPLTGFRIVAVPKSAAESRRDTRPD